ncbi:hypothetical protein [Komagataeibacter xylinus]|uniref:hypothetical protein n=1 Tax=Komagataeibacter xylinus TaxID=28448 RepID=UPI00280BA2C7|nr:hypothetical protein [Komagataeibacter xylinus]
MSDPESGPARVRATGLIAAVLGIIIIPVAAHADNQHFDGGELAQDAPQYFVLRPDDAATAAQMGELRLSESSIDFSNGERLDVMPDPGGRAGHLLYRVEYGQNPVMPTGNLLCAAPLNPLYLDFAAQGDDEAHYDMTLYCSSRVVPFRAIGPGKSAAVFHYTRATDTVWAHSPAESGYLHGAVAQYCTRHHAHETQAACTAREESAYAGIMARHVAPPVLKQCAAYVTGRREHAGYVSFAGLLNCARLHDSRAVFDYCAARITGQKRADDTTFFDASPAQADGAALCFNALAARQAHD